MRLYQFMTAEAGRNALIKRHLRVSRLLTLNDPFEFLSAQLGDPELRKALQLTKTQLSATKGLLCFSKSWHSPVLWSHYADRHHGLCLGFDIPVGGIRQVSYVNSRIPWPAVVDQFFVEQLLYTKFVHWSYEDEYRAWVSLDAPIDGHYYADFSDCLKLKQVLVGAASSVTRAQVSAALGDLENQIEAFKVRPAFRTFRVVRNKDESLWS
jgi:hypothetical protein